MTGIETILNKWAEEQRNELVQKYHSLGLKASGKFEKELSQKSIPNGVQIWSASHTEFMQYGREKNQSQDPVKMKKWVGWAGSTFLKKWVSDKGLDISPFAVAWKIAREGIKVPNKYNAGTLLDNLMDSRVIDELKNELGFAQMKEIKSEIIRIWQQ